ncbi:MAG: helix-turn-helix transcriptional regulator [Bacteroidia bacterium]
MKLDNIKLRKFREKHRLSQAEFAESIGLSQATVCEWERKDTEIKLEYYTKLVDIYGNSINELIIDGAIINHNTQLQNTLNQNTKVETEVKIDLYQLQNDYLQTLKATNEFYQKSITSLVSNFSDLIKKLGNN